MKKRNIVAALAFACLGFTASPANAALTYTADDLMLGFYATDGEGVSQSLLINIGQASVYRDFAGTSMTLNLGNIGADLSFVFGDDWSTRSDVKWGVFGGTFNLAVGSDPSNTLYATKRRTNINTLAPAYNSSARAPQSAVATKFKDQGDAYTLGTATANSPVATIQDDTIDNDFGGFQPGNNGVSSSYSYFGFDVLANFANGTAGSVADLYRMPVGSGPGSYEGTFTINNAGVVQFAAVPEPGTVALLLMAAGMVGFGLIRQRKVATV